MENVTVTFDGLEVQAPRGVSVLEAARRNGVYIPHLCYHPDLTPSGACRLCVVEIEGQGMVASCLVPVEDGLAVNTDSSRVARVRRVATELLIANHPATCLSCVEDSRCELQRIAAYVGIDPEHMARLHQTVKTVPVDTSNPFFDFDANKCVLCGICVRTCEEIVGANALDFALRGYDTTISAFGGSPIVESRCESCGECVVRCPVGSLTFKAGRMPSHEVETVCTYCGVGCGIYLGVRGDQIVSARGKTESPVNGGSLCVKGRFGHRFINHPDRLKTPLIKRDVEFVEATWDEALDLVASKLAEHKGDDFAALASAKCTNEENYVLQKLGRAVLGTQNIDHCARL